MAETLTLPNGETVTPSDVFLFENYPYRFQPVPGDGAAFELSPLYWGGGQMDVPFADREALAAQWGEDSAGTLTDAEWEAWLAEARADDRFEDEELDAVAAELGLAEDPAAPAADDGAGGVVERLKRLFGG